MAVAFVSSTSGVVTTAAALGTTSTSIGYGTDVAVNRMAIISVATKPSTATFPATLADAAGRAWTLLTDVTGGAGTNAADTGPTRLAKYYRILDGTESGSVTITSTGGSAVHATMEIYSSATGGWVAPVSVTANDSTASTNPSAASGTWPSTLSSGDTVHVAYSSPTDSTAVPSAYTVSRSGSVFSDSTVRSRRLNSSGNQGQIITWDASLTSGSGTGATTVGFTWSATTSGPFIITRLRERAVDNVSTVVDNFDNNAVDNPPWSANYGGTSEVDGRARVDCTTAFSGYQTGSIYAFDSFYLRAYPADPAGATGGFTACWFAAASVPAGTDIGFYYELSTNTLQLCHRTAYYDAGATIIPYDPVAHAWWRLRIDGSNLQWETSADASTWTVQRTIATPSWVTSTKQGRLLLEARRVDGTPNYAEFDNLNFTPVVVVQQGTVPMSAASELAANGVVARPASASLSAASELSAAATRTVAGSAALSAASSLTATATRIASAGATLTAASGLAAAAFRTTQDLVALSAASALSVAAVRILPATAPLTASSSLTAAAGARYEAVAALSAASSLAVSATRVVTATVTMSAATGLAADAFATVRATTTLSAASALSVAPVTTMGASAALSASSGLTATGIRSTTATVALSAASDLTLAATNTALAQALLSAETDLAAGATPVGAVNVDLTASTDLDAAGIAARPAALALTATSALTAAPLLTARAATALSAATGLAVQATASRHGSAALTAASALIVDSGAERQATATLSAASGLALTITRSSAAGVIMDASTSLAVVGRTVLPATTTLSAITDLTAAATSVRRATLPLSAASTLAVAAPQGASALSVAMSAISALTINAPHQNAAARATLSAASNLTVTGRVTRVAAVAMTSQSGLTVLGVRAVLAQATLSAATGLTVSSLRTVGAQVTLGATTNLQVTALQLLRAVLTMSASSHLEATVSGSTRAATVLMDAATELTFNLTSIPLVFAHPHQVVRTDPPGRLGRSTTGMITASRRRPTVVKTPPITRRLE